MAAISRLCAAPRASSTLPPSPCRFADSPVMRAMLCARSGAKVSPRTTESASRSPSVVRWRYMPYSLIGDDVMVAMKHDAHSCGAACYIQADNMHQRAPNGFCVPTPIGFS